MYSIAATGLFSSGPATMTAGITDLELVETAAGVRLISTTRAGGGIMVLSTGAKMALVDSEVLATSPALPGPGRLDLISLGGRDLVCVSGATDDRAWGFDLGDSGGLGAVVGLTGSPQGRISASAAIELPAGRFAFHAVAGENGIAVSRITADGSFVEVSLAPLSAGLGGDIAAMAVAKVAGVPLLLALSAAGNAVQSYLIGPKGRLSLAATLDAAGGFGVASPSAIEVVTVGGATMAVVAAAGSSSVSVLKLAGDGTMRVVDHVIDTLDTRFQGLCALETAVVDGRAFVIAGGGDGGLTLLELMPDGRLLSVAQIGDGAGDQVGPISAITARVTGSQIEIYAAGEGTGIYRFSVDVGLFSPAQMGTIADERINGGAFGDYLDGGAGNDRLEGAAGADILRDGAGKDTLYGGAGADVFVLAADGASDLIVDFELGVDRIDLSAWGRVYSLEGLKFNTNAHGFLLSFGSEYLTVRTAADVPILKSSLTVADLFDLWHLPHAPEAGQRIAGTRAAELQSGGAGDDLLIGSGGADQLVGGAGFDTVDYARGRNGLRVDLETGSGQGGMAAGDSYQSIEAVRGGHGDDRILGDATGNTLDGGPGRDRLSGREGADVLSGGGRSDWFDGGTGEDTIIGGKGLDVVSYGNSQAAVSLDLATGRGQGGLAEGDVLRGIERVIGSAWEDRLAGAAGDETLFGGGGADVLNGRAGADRLDGGRGDDEMSGGAGADSFRFAKGGGGDRILDFSINEGDHLVLNAALFADGPDPARILARYGHIMEGDLVLDFGSGDVLTLSDGAALISETGWITLI